jgi:calcium binding protein
MIEQATVDAYGDSEQTTGWLTVIEENLTVPFETVVLGMPVTVERVDLDRSEQIVRDLQARASTAVASYWTSITY